MNKQTQFPRFRVHLTLAASLLLAAVIGPWSPSLAAAQPGGGDSAPCNTGYDLGWWTVDGGGYTFSAGEGYTLGGTAGQPDAAVLTDAGYVLAGGFWRGGIVAARYTIYLPLVVRDL